jgi:hypothetical protein
MALTGIANTSPPVSTISRTVTPTALLTESGGIAILDFYATINTAVRLLKRYTKTPEFSGGVWRIAEKEFEYPTNYASTFNPASPLSAPFTLALGTQIGETTYSKNQVMLPTIFAAAGDTLLT